MILGLRLTEVPVGLHRSFLFSLPRMTSKVCTTDIVAVRILLADRLSVRLSLGRHLELVKLLYA